MLFIVNNGFCYRFFGIFQAIFKELKNALIAQKGQKALIQYINGDTKSPPIFLEKSSLSTPAIGTTSIKISSVDRSVSQSCS